MIEALARTLPDFALFTSFPGAGAVFAARLAAAFGERRERYGSAGRSTDIRGYRLGHRAQRQQMLGALAPAVPQVLATNVRRVRRPVNPALLLCRVHSQALASITLVPIA